MISQVHRFHGRNTLTRVYRQGKTVRGPNIALKHMRNHRTKTYRAAVVVSRKVHKSAVVRNRIRRRIYEALRSNEPDIQDPHDLIFVIYGEEFAEMEFSSLQNEVTTLLKKAAVI